MTIDTEEELGRLTRHQFSFLPKNLLSDCVRYLAAIDAQKAEIERLRSALKDTTAHLVAATSLLEDGGREAAASDKMFNTLIQDYHRGIDRARAALLEREP